MAESGLSIQYTDITREVARFAGWDRAAASWTADQISDFADILKRGLLQFYYPPTMSPNEPRHEWSFLRVAGSLSIAASDYDYDLPDNFSGVLIDDSVTFGSGSTLLRLEKVDDSTLRAMRSSTPSTGTPTTFCVRTKAHAPTTGMRYELLLYPTPDRALTLEYRYVAIPDVIDGTNLYPYGGAIHSQTILLSCLAEAERILDDDVSGENRKSFMAQLAASIRLDRGHQAVPQEMTQG